MSTTHRKLSRLPINLLAVPWIAQLPCLVMKKWSLNCWTSHINHALESSPRGSLVRKSLSIALLNPTGLITSSSLTGFTGKVRTTEHTALYAEMCVLHQLTLSKNQESAFITSGFNNWKDATRAFELHRKSSCHRKAILKWEHHTGVGIGLQLQRRLAAEQIEARNCLHKIFTSIEYIARQALPLRGHQEERGNLYQVIKLWAADFDWLKK